MISFLKTVHFTDYIDETTISIKLLLTQRVCQHKSCNYKNVIRACDHINIDLLFTRRHINMTLITFLHIQRDKINIFVKSNTAEK